MGEKEDTEEIVKQLINRGEEKLNSSQILLNNNQFDDSISRSYYAAYLASKALLLLLGSSPKTHSGVITMLSLKAIKEGILPEKIGKYISHLLEARQNSDYAVFTYYDNTDAQDFFKKAQKVVSFIKNIIRDKFEVDLH